MLATLTGTTPAALRECTRRDVALIWVITAERAASA